MSLSEKSSTVNGEVHNGIDHSAKNAGTIIHGTADKMAEAAESGVNRIVDKVHHSIDKIAETTGKTAENLKKRQALVTNFGTGLLDDSKNYVKENPLLSIGIAVAIGFVLSKLWDTR